MTRPPHRLSTTQFTTCHDPTQHTDHLLTEFSSTGGFSQLTLLTNIVTAVPLGTATVYETVAY
jgi:hypothetical protein